MLNLKTSAAASALVLFAGSAFAAPISGGIGFTGDFQGLDENDQLVSDLTNAVFIETDDDTIDVAEREGDFTDVDLGTTVQAYADFSLTNPNLPINNFWTVQGNTTMFSFRMTSLSVVDQSTEFIDLVGSGIVSAAGFDDTAASYNASLNLEATEGSEFVISTLSDATVTTPEPATLALVGTGLLVAGGAVARRRRPVT